jgi:inositol 1,4,5-triphosphate receptor type 1
LRATSLDTAEGEGDQLDVKSLQNQLEKTQDLVGQLSKQLMELKDQVKNELKLNFCQVP